MEPTAGKRRRYSTEFRAKIVLEVLRGELTITQLVAKHGVHHTLFNAWKRQAVEAMAAEFSGKAEAGEAGERPRG